MTVRFGSVCSGIEAASIAWEPLGWQAAWFSEIEPFPRAVLSHHWPDVPLHGDFTRLRDRVADIAGIDVLVGGTPCQAFSIAGLRRSLGDDRGNLTLEFVRLADAIDDFRRADGQQPIWITWENVPGVLSVADNAFGAFLAGLCGHDAPIEPSGGKRWPDAGVVHGPRRCAAWRVLDAQHFGLAQRRRRVFVLARDGAGDWSAADALLPVTESLRWHPAPRREAGKDAACGAVSGTLGSNHGNIKAEHAWTGQLIPVVATTLRARDGAKGVDSDATDTLIPVAFGGDNTAGPIDAATCLNAHGGAGRMDFESETFCVTGDVAHTLRADGFDASEDGTGRGTPIVSTRAAGVRRLTPTECERLQGFLDGHTRIPWRGRPAEECPDGPRYKSLGNSMAVPCMRYLGERIAAVMRERP